MTTDKINMAPKTYLQGAWDFATALFKEPHKTLDTTANGVVLSTDAPTSAEKGFLKPAMMVGGGALLAGAGLFSFNLLALGGGLVLASAGAGRFHAIGEAATAEQKIRVNEIVVDEVKKRFPDLQGPDAGQP